MAEQPDKESKTELATDKKLQDAREKGNQPFSREVANVAYLLAALIVVGIVLEFSVKRLAVDLSALMENAGSIRIGNEYDVMALLRTVCSGAAIAALQIVAIFMLAGVASAVIQNAPKPVLQRIMPEFTRISPFKGFKRMFGAAGLLEMGKMLFRFTAFIVCGIVLMKFARIDVQNAGFLDPVSSFILARKGAIAAICGVLCASVVLLILDHPMSYGLWRRELRMTHQEVKDEHKESEGDPHIKARRRSIARSQLRKRNLTAVANATVVITNPTHFAVALQYVRQQGGAPKVVAKGRDLIALEIRRIATENSVPIVEDKLLARSLYAKVDVGQTIPIEFFRIVAEILVRLQTKTKRITYK